MALSRLDSLYMAVVGDHSKNPHHHGFLEDVEQVNLNNPTCVYRLNLMVIKYQILPLQVMAVRFQPLHPV